MHKHTLQHLFQAWTRAPLGLPMLACANNIECGTIMIRVGLMSGLTWVAACGPETIDFLSNFI